MQKNYRSGEPARFGDAFGRHRATGVRPIEEVESTNIPLLMIYGYMDQRVPFSITDRINRWRSLAYVDGAEVPINIEK